MKFDPENLKKQLRLLMKLIATYISINKKLFLVVTLLSFAAIYFFPQIKPIIFRSKPVRIGMVGNYTISTLPRSLQDKISFGLTRLTVDNQATQGAAISWEATDSGKIVTFELNTNLVWQDNKPFTSDQVNYNLRGVEITRPNDNQIKFVLKEPFAPLVSLLSQPLFKNGLIGLGDFQVTSVKFAGRFLSSLELKNLKTEKVEVYKFYPSDTVLLTALKLGSIDEAQGLKIPPSTDISQQYRIDKKIENNTEAIVFFNTGKKPLDDKSIRQGLAYAIPDEFPFGETTDTPLPKDHWAGSTAAKKYPQNLSLAQKTLNKNGLKLVLSTHRELESVAKDLAKNWNEAGVETVVQTTDIVPLNYDVYLTYVDLPSDPDQYILWHSTQTSNISGYKSPKVDKLLEEGRTTLNMADRKEIYASFQKAVTEDAPAAFLFYPNVYSIKKR